MGTSKYGKKQKKPKKSRDGEKKPKKRRGLVPCPHCQHRVSEVLRTTPGRMGADRERKCLGCGKTYLTGEYAKGTDTGVIGPDTGVETLKELKKLLSQLKSKM